jgi:hypothetical protein
VIGAKDEVTGSTNVAGFAGWICELNIILDIGIHDGQDMIIWAIFIEGDRNMSVCSLLWVYRS